MTLTPAEHSAYVLAAELAERSVEDFVIEESLHLAEMLIAAGRHNIELARNRMAATATIPEAFQRLTRERPSRERAAARARGTTTRRRADRPMPTGMS